MAKAKCELPVMFEFCNTQFKKYFLFAMGWSMIRDCGSSWLCIFDFYHKYTQLHSHVCFSIYSRVLLTDDFQDMLKQYMSLDARKLSLMQV